MILLLGGCGASPHRGASTEQEAAESHELVELMRELAHEGDIAHWRYGRVEVVVDLAPATPPPAPAVDGFIAVEEPPPPPAPALPILTEGFLVGESASTFEVLHLVDPVSYPRGSYRFVPSEQSAREALLGRARGLSVPPQRQYGLVFIGEAGFGGNGDGFHGDEEKLAIVGFLDRLGERDAALELASTILLTREQALDAIATPTMTRALMDATQMPRRALAERFRRIGDRFDGARIADRAEELGRELERMANEDAAWQADLASPFERWVYELRDSGVYYAPESFALGYPTGTAWAPTGAEARALFELWNDRRPTRVLARAGDDLVRIGDFAQYWLAWLAGEPLDNERVAEEFVTAVESGDAYRRFYEAARRGDYTAVMAMPRIDPEQGMIDVAEMARSGAVPGNWVLQMLQMAHPDDPRMNDYALQLATSDDRDTRVSAVAMLCNARHPEWVSLTIGALSRSIEDVRTGEEQLERRRRDGAEPTTDELAELETDVQYVRSVLGLLVTDDSAETVRNVEAMLRTAPARARDVLLELGGVSDAWMRSRMVGDAVASGLRDRTDADNSYGGMCDSMRADNVAMVVASWIGETYECVGPRRARRLRIHEIHNAFRARRNEPALPPPRDPPRLRALIERAQRATTDDGARAAMEALIASGNDGAEVVAELATTLGDDHPAQDAAVAATRRLSSLVRRLVSSEDAPLPTSWRGAPFDPAVVAGWVASTIAAHPEGGYLTVQIARTSAIDIGVSPVFGAFGPPASPGMPAVVECSAQGWAYFSEDSSFSFGSVAPPQAEPGHFPADRGREQWIELFRQVLVLPTEQPLTTTLSLQWTGACQ